MLSAVSYPPNANIGDIMPDENDTTLYDIPPDTTLVLTEEYDRLFKAAGCKPTCHACLKAITVGRKFTLVSHCGQDVMICDKKFCDLDKVIRRPSMDARNERERRQRYITYHVRQFGTRPGFSRPSLKR